MNEHDLPEGLVLAKYWKTNKGNNESRGDGGTKRGSYLTEDDFRDIPATEISDVAADASPLVSVLMITWNHRVYTQAIKSIRNQQCSNFPFELNIGENFSQGGTRAICADYQRWFPDRIHLIVSDGQRERMLKR